MESTRVKVKRRKKKNGARLGLKNESDTTAMLRGGDENGTFTSDLRTYENEESLYLTSSAQRRRESKTPSIIQQYKQSTKRVRKEVEHSHIKILLISRLKINSFHCTNRY